MYVKVPLTVAAATRVNAGVRSLQHSRQTLAWDRWPTRWPRPGRRAQHISNNAPRDICDLDVEKRKTGIEVAKKWLDGAKIVGAKSMRVNSGGPRHRTGRGGHGRLSKADDLAKYLANCIESFKEMATTAARLESKVTLENHWG